jgi:hypothetical protein
MRRGRRGSGWPGSSVPRVLSVWSRPRRSCSVPVDRGLAPVHRLIDRCLPRPGPHRRHHRGLTLAGVDHQDRQQPRPPVARRGRLAPPQDLCHPRSDDAGPLGPGTRRGTGPRPRRQPTAAPTLAGVHPNRTPQMSGQRSSKGKVAARGTTREPAMSNRRERGCHARLLDRGPVPAEQPVLR